MRADLRGPLTSHIQTFIAHKRALGKRLEKREATLYLLDRYLIEHDVTKLDDVTPALLDAFMRSRPRHAPRSYNELLGTVRGFFDWLVRHDVLAISPLLTPPRRVTPTRRPFLFNSDLAKQLFDAAARLRSYSRCPRRGETYRMMFALLYGLGLRVGEVSRLCLKDVDFDRRLFVIRGTKFGKHRLVPFGLKMAKELTEFLQRREVLSDTMLSDLPLFSFAKNQRTPIRANTISQTFHNLLPALDLIIPPGVASPRLHCLRHSFAVGTLLRWYRTGVDPAARLLDLSTFLGHVSPSSTAVYLTITTELLECASQRFAHFATPVFKGCVR
jgi:site-specific recombinase XerD